MIHGSDPRRAAVNWLVAFGVVLVFLKLMQSLWLLHGLSFGVPL